MLKWFIDDLKVGLSSAASLKRTAINNNGSSFSSKDLSLLIVSTSFIYVGFSSPGGLLDSADFRSVDGCDIMVKVFALLIAVIKSVVCQEEMQLCTSEQVKGSAKKSTAKIRN